MYSRNFESKQRTLKVVQILYLSLLYISVRMFVLYVR